MGLFEDLGERVERFKQEVTDVAEDEAEYECADCGERLYTDHDRCPNCDADAVVSRDLGGDSSEDGQPATDEGATRDGGSTPHETDETGGTPGQGDRKAEPSDESRASDPDGNDVTDPEA